MRKSFGSLVASLVALAAWLSFVPAAGAATLRVALERPDIFPLGVEQTVYIDAFVVDLDNTNERLSAFTLRIDGPTFSPQGVRFGPPVNTTFPKPANHRFVFDGFPGVEPEDFRSTYYSIQVAAALPASQDEVDVTGNRNGLVRIPIIIPANPAPGWYVLTVDPSATDFAGNGAPITSEGFGITIPIWPEPSGASLLAVGFAALLRRHRGPTVQCQ